MLIHGWYVKNNYYELLAYDYLGLIYMYEGEHLLA